MNPIISQAIRRIPEQLRREDFRFVPIWSGEKKPFEWGWNIPGGKNNYCYYDPKLAGFLIEGHNWGTLTGIGGLIIFDADHFRLKALGIMDRLPKTFTVRTGGGGYHLYYICMDIKEKVIMYDRELMNDKGDPQHLGEIQTLGFQAVGPGCLHPNGNRYVIEADLPIAEISWESLYNILSEKIEFGLAKKEKKKHIAIKVKDPSAHDPFSDVNIEDVIYPKGKVKKNGSIVKGAHPIHGSNGGYNFQIDTDENTWFCFRCWKGGGPALAVAMQAGILRCDQCGPGVLRGADFITTVKAAEKQGLIKQRKPSIVLERWEE